MSVSSAFGKVAAVIAVPVVIGGCCGGSLLTLGAITAIFGSAGTWLIGFGGLASIIATTGVFLFIRTLRQRASCQIEQKERLYD